ncbi:cupin domain-containing protein [Porphyromonas sp.]|uniref:cupin domain-containing protein n=1 Tax=Porphyromonas sp. TaxID=1924944 RepID=UPI0026DAC92E|nr:cupin domain-containing protein [Porphyromonas sp.]MDO4771179.1 cupin domain-containing protein [Porphyromonas sp.]
MVGKELAEFGRLLDTPELMLVHIELDTDKTVPAHDHKGQEVFFTVVKGQVEVTLNGEEKHLLSPGKVLHFPGEASIAAKALEPSEFFVYLVNRR